MKFAIFREIEIRGTPSRKFLIEWNKNEIVKAFLDEGLDIKDVLDRVIEKFKKESIKIP